MGSAVSGILSRGISSMPRFWELGLVDEDSGTPPHISSSESGMTKSFDVFVCVVATNLKWKAFLPLLIAYQTLLMNGRSTHWGVGHNFK